MCTEPLYVHNGFLREGFHWKLPLIESSLFTFLYVLKIITHTLKNDHIYNKERVIYLGLFKDIT